MSERIDNFEDIEGLGVSDIDYTTPANLPDDATDRAERLEWHVRMVRLRAAQLAETEAMYKREMDRLKARLAHRTAVLKSAIAWHTAPVQSHHLMQLAETKQRTIEYPHGASKVTVPKTRVVELPYHDEQRDLVHDWMVRDHSDHLVLPNITTIRALVDVREISGLTDSETPEWVAIDTATGEIIRSLVVRLPDPTYTLKPEPGEPF